MTQLPTNLLKAMLTIAAKKDVRYYLKGVCIDVISGEHINVIATDGACLVAAKTCTENNLPLGQVIIPRTALGPALKAYGKLAALTLAHVDGDNWTIQGTPFKHDGRFPDYRRVPPAASNDPLVAWHANPELINRVANALKVIRNGSAKYNCAFTSRDGRNITAHDEYGNDLVGLVMCWTVTDRAYEGFKG